MFIDEVLQLIRDIFLDVIEFFTYLPLLVFQGLLGALITVIEGLPPPDFLVTYTIGDLISDDLAWVLGQTNFGEGLAIVLAGYTFYFVRRVGTLGIW